VEVAVTDSDVLTHIAGLVQGEITLSEFEDWFLTEALDEDTALIRKVSAVLAETAGNTEDAVAVRLLRTLLPTLTMTTSGLSGGGVIVVGYQTEDFGPGSANITEPRKMSVA
jgi:hypothetical protein